MTDLDPIGLNILRAIYQISGFTESRVDLDQIVDVTSIETGKLQSVLDALQARNLVRWSAERTGVELTSDGFSQAERLPSIGEPPLFQDI